MTRQDRHGRVEAAEMQKRCEAESEHHARYEGRAPDDHPPDRIPRELAGEGRCCRCIVNCRHQGARQKRHVGEPPGGKTHQDAKKPTSQPAEDQADSG